MRQWQKAFGGTEAIAHEVAHTLSPIEQVGNKFRDSMFSAADKLAIALGNRSALDAMLEPTPPWKEKGKSSMLDAENYRPGWNDPYADFTEANQRAKDTATAERLARVRQQAEAEWQRKLRESTEKINESFSGLSDIGKQLQQALGPNYANRSVGNMTASVGEQERKSRGTGASFDGAFKSGEDSSGSAMNQGVSGYGFWPDGTPKTSEEFSSSKRDALSHEDDHAGTKAKQQAVSGKGGEKQTSPAAAALARIEAILARVEPKIPQHILS